MNLHGIKFGNVLGASGVQGFFGDGYWFHRIPFHRPDFSGSTFVSKTTTLHPRAGNMPLTKGFRPKHWFPSCIKAQWNGNMLNAVGLSGPGLRALLATGNWQSRTEPFFISLMCMEETPSRRFDEMRRMVDILGEEKSKFRAPFGLQENRSCPNMGLGIGEIVKESSKSLEIAGTLGVPVMQKYAVDTAPVAAIKELEEHPNLAAICVSNTIKFGWKGIDWKKVWGSDVSPLLHLGGGGLSGPKLLPFVCHWIKELRDLGFKKPINGGGGIFCEDDVDEYYLAGANSVFVGTVATRHPRRVAKIIRRANSLTWS